MGEPNVCLLCAGGSWRSDWGPYCSAGCEHLAVLAQVRAEGAAAERASIAVYLRAQAEVGDDPWMVYVADEIAAGAPTPPGPMRTETRAACVVRAAGTGTDGAGR